MKSYNKMMEVIKPTGIICYGMPFVEITGNIKAISPFDQEELIAKMGFENYMKKYISGELYPTR